MAHDKESELKSAACQVVHEYRDWKLPDIPGSWEQTLAPLFEELQRRCPGFTRQQYSDALDYGFRMEDDKEAELKRTAYQVADEYRDGKPAHISRSWKETWASLSAELQRRCPGFTSQQYDDALEYGFKASR